MWWKWDFGANIPNTLELFKSFIPFARFSGFMSHFPGILEGLNSGFIREKYWGFFPSSNPLYHKESFAHVALFLRGNTV